MDSILWKRILQIGTDITLRGFEQAGSSMLGRQQLDY